MEMKEVDSLIEEASYVLDKSSTPMCNSRNRLRDIQDYKLKENKTIDALDKNTIDINLSIEESWDEVSEFQEPSARFKSSTKVEMQLNRVQQDLLEEELNEVQLSEWTK